MNYQLLKTGGGDELVVLTRAEFDRLVESLEDKRDAAQAERILARIHAGREEVFPAKVLDAILAGSPAAKVLREYRRLTQRALAKAAGVNPAYLSQIERGARRAGKSTAQALAKALRVPAEMIAE